MMRCCWFALLLAAAACDEVIVAAAGVAEQLQELRQSPEPETNVSFTESLVQELSQPWSRMINHRFTDELATGTLNLGVLRCYLVQDHRFLDSFVVLLSSMISRAHSLKDRIPGAQFLGLITGKENTYFERSFEALGVSEAVRESTPSAPVTSSFIDLMRNVAATGNFAEMLAVLVAAEWSYQSWGERVLPKAVEGPFYFREWVDLHSGPYFGSVVAYFRGLLDAEAKRLKTLLGGGKVLAAARERFEEAVSLEYHFFEYCYAPGQAL